MLELIVRNTSQALIVNQFKGWYVYSNLFFIVRLVKEFIIMFSYKQRLQKKHIKIRTLVIEINLIKVFSTI